MGKTGQRVHIGLGVANRRDGGVGIWLARALSQRGLPVLTISRDDAALIEAMDTHSDLVLLDATHAGHPPGTVTRIDAAAGPVPQDLFRHPAGSIGLGELVETARSLGCLPPKLLLIGIEGQDFSQGVGLSPKVEWAAARLIETLAAQTG
ncbi:hydrogenase maturation protease [Tropicimonas sp. IMCC6043]|uniref:hydrogenase maturation protease n=1 Tax=Tropicimonas sp. IMCC6043 TaxID=2510645 RepID=UPI0013EB4604|nr:hydrogenase maturation protease [Tropicimonas sp. IMCC6043]